MGDAPDHVRADLAKPRELVDERADAVDPPLTNAQRIVVDADLGPRHDHAPDPACDRGVADEQAIEEVAVVAGGVQEVERARQAVAGEQPRRAKRRLRIDVDIVPEGHTRALVAGRRREQIRDRNQRKAGPLGQSDDEFPVVVESVDPPGVGLADVPPVVVQVGGVGRPVGRELSPVAVPACRTLHPAAGGLDPAPQAHG